jgi:hypothetical protein
MKLFWDDDELLVHNEENPNTLRGWAKEQLLAEKPRSNMAGIASQYIYLMDGDEDSIMLGRCLIDREEM